MNKPRHAKIEKILSDYFKPIKMELIDESHKHIGHEGAKTGLSHYKLIIESEKLNNLNAITQHRLIYQALGDLMQTDIHALSIIIHA
jgi:BolA protein